MFQVVVHAGSLFICHSMFEAAFLLMLFVWTLFTDTTFLLFEKCLVLINVDSLFTFCFHVQISVVCHDCLLNVVHRTMTSSFLV